MKYGATYGNRNPKPRRVDEMARDLMSSVEGREAIREVLDEEQAALEFSMYRGRDRVFPADEFGAERVLDAAVFGGVNVQMEPDDEIAFNKYGGKA